ncbi:2-deoxy-scyllo-inosose synthase [mine drainage metagenome]|uniref:2-deoxy-scyllo-inosose synthase n=1 Tax=mine drainage metagenome TaxID=410659 RepID=A0A1J5QR63_9ZZZZ
MSESFEIHSSLQNYGIRIGTELIESIFAGDDDFVILSDAGLVRHWPQLVHPRNISIVAEEEAKTLDTVAQVIEKMRNLGANRQSRMIAIGGGIVQDIATFCASSYMRGIKWVYFPTTLLGMVDSCVGGKSSINVGQYKNIVGNYYPPREIIIDTNFCRSLPLTQKVAGQCEAAKICFAHRGDAFDRYLALASAPDLFDEAVLGKVISLSLRTKKEFIEEDEFDQGVRLLLNFGHTFGHAIEGASHFAISHGVAVGLGILAALHFSVETGTAKERSPRAAALADHMKWLLRQVPNLAEDVAALSPADALFRFKSDKKHRKDQYAMILVDDEGYLVHRLIPIGADSELRIIRAFEAMKKEYDEV